MTVINPEIYSISAHNADETAFATADGSYSGRDIRLSAKPNLQLTQDWIADPGVRQRIAETRAGIMGLRKAKLSLATFLRGTGTAAGNAVAALGYANLVEGQLMRNALGGESLGTGTTINDASATASSFTVASAAGLAEGQAIMIGGEASVIDDITGSVVTLRRALSAAPADTTPVYASATYYPVEALSGGTLQLQCMGAETDYWRLLGGQAAVKFANLGIGQLPQAQYEITGADWAAYTGGSIDADSYSNETNPSPIGFSSSLYVQDFGTATRNLVNFSSITIDPGLSFESLASGSGVQGVQAYRRQTVKPLIEFVTEYSDDWRDDFEAQTAKYLHLQIGSTAGQTILIEVQRFYLNKSVERNPYNSQLGSKVAGEGRDNSAAGSTDLLQAAIRVHLL
jgi:hypothetical protein